MSQIKKTNLYQFAHASGGAALRIERRLQIAAKILPHEIMKRLNVLQVVFITHILKPSNAGRDMRDLVLVKKI